MTMANLDEMQVRTLVDETDLGRVSPGLPAQVVVEAYPNRNFRGTVLKIEPQAVVDQNVTMFPVLVRLDNREKLLKPGMNADVQIEVARRDDVVAVPNAAIVSIRDAVAAGDVLGLSEETVQKALRGALGNAMEGAENGAQAADQPAETPPQAEAAAAQTTADCAALRQKLQQGGFAALTDEERTGLRACRPQGAAAFGQAQGGSSDVRPGVVFVKTASGFEPRSVTLGVNDWEFTEVVTGLEAGDSVVLISVAQLQRAQEEFNARMRERMGGFPGAGGRR
jgi:HlyD family secretion protein